jgi:asparagine synthase (glutamine-hydrolysing)
MCGIAGGTGPASAQEPVVARQLATLLHRGPDASATTAGTEATIGQTRLAVMDPQHGDPPLKDESGDIRAALNGEIYNYRALQAALEADGHRFRSHCDTEVVAHLAERMEPADLARSLRGMFAFAVWDERRRRLVLGRDRFGKKPLFYWYDGRDLVFGSELKAVLADPRVPRIVDPDVVPAYLAFGYVPSPSTFFRGIRSVPPATVLVWERGQVRTERYWELPTDASFFTGDAEELAGETRRLLREAVRERLAADVPLGAFLSGGLDSSAVVALMAPELSQPVKTFCIGFDETSYDERRWAALVARRFDTDHTEDVVRADAATLLEQVLSACDQPFADSSALPTYLLCQMTRRHVTVALSGDGGDEVFAGYDRFAAGLLLERVNRAPRAPLAAARRLGRHVAGGDGRARLTRAGRLLALAGLPMPAAYEGLVRLFDDDWLASAGLPAQAAAHADTWALSAGQPTLHRLLDLNRRTYLVDDLLVKADRMSMAHALEVRSPFLDHRLVEFAGRVPARLHSRGRHGKRLLKLAMAADLPPEVVNRPKRGFGVPLDSWFRKELSDEARAIAQPGARISQFVPASAVARLVQQQAAGTAAHGQRLWSLLMLERFLEREHA